MLLFSIFQKCNYIILRHAMYIYTEVVVKSMVIHCGGVRSFTAPTYLFQ